jgi:hypothetical protein
MKLTLAIRHSLVESRDVLIIIFCISLMSANELAFSREVHGVHNHGVANLTVAFENGAMEIQFVSPAVSLLGFEHKPKTQKQIETIEKTKTLLNSATKVISIGGANCSPDRVNVDILGPAGQALKGDEEQEQGHDHHDSDEEYIENDRPDVSHSEVSAMYGFDCVDDDELQSVTISLFEYFSGLEKINVNWVTATQQGEATLRPESSTLELR